MPHMGQFGKRFNIAVLHSKTAIFKAKNVLLLPMKSYKLYAFDYEFECVWQVQWNTQTIINVS